MLLSALYLFFIMRVDPGYFHFTTSEWRGIIPLHTTRAEIKEILGIEPSGKAYDHFELKDYEGKLSYTNERCEKRVADGWNVPVGTVFRIDVLPKIRIGLADLKVDLSRFKVSNVYDVSSLKIYSDEESGFEFQHNELRDRVVYLTYFPSKKDAHLRCQP